MKILLQTIAAPATPALRRDCYKHMVLHPRTLVDPRTNTLRSVYSAGCALPDRLVTEWVRRADLGATIQDAGLDTKDVDGALDCARALKNLRNLPKTAADDDTTGNEKETP